MIVHAVDQPAARTVHRDPRSRNWRAHQCRSRQKCRHRAGTVVGVLGGNGPIMANAQSAQGCSALPRCPRQRDIHPYLPNLPRAPGGLNHRSRHHPRGGVQRWQNHAGLHGQLDAITYDSIVAAMGGEALQQAFGRATALPWSLDHDPLLRRVRRLSGAAPADPVKRKLHFFDLAVQKRSRRPAWYSRSSVKKSARSSSA